MELDVLDAMRYLGAGDCPPERARREMAAVARELTERLWPKYTYRVFSLNHEPEGIRLVEADILLQGKLAGTMLADCRQAAVLACTLGAEFDAMLRREQVRDMGKAAMLNACGSALVESGCDEVEEKIAERFPGHFLTDRFSPGYGDLPLSLQPSICAALDTQRRGVRFVFDEPRQDGDGCHRSGGETADGPHPWMRLLRCKRDLRTAQGREALWNF